MAVNDLVDAATLAHRELVPSQRDVATYDLKPQMSARQVATAFEHAFVAGGVSLSDTGTLADVAPTVLELLGMPQPAAMTGHSLLGPIPALVAASS